MATLKYKNQNGEYVTLPNYTVKTITPVQTTGESTTDVMSQKAVTDAINNINVEIPDIENFATKTDITELNNRIDNLDIPEIPTQIVNSINGQTGVVTIDIPTLPNNIVNTVNGQSGDVTIPISNLATKEELATEVNNLNTAINNIKHPEDLVKSVNGKTGNVTIGINDISGLSSQLNTFVTESEVDNKINNINIDFSDNSGIGIDPTNGLTVKLSNGGTAKINKNGIQVFDSTGLEKIKLVDKDVNINDSEFTPTVVTKNIKNANTVISLTSAPTEVKKYTMFIDNSTNAELQYQATSTNNDCNISIGGNFYFAIDGGNSNETEYYNIGIGVFNSNNELIKTLSNLAIKITKSQTGSSSYSRTGYYYCKGSEVTENNQDTLTWETATNGINQDLSTSTWYCCSTNLQKLGIYVYAIKPSYSATSCTVTYTPQGFTGYCTVNNYNPQKIVIGTNGILNYKTNRNYFGAYTENNQFKIIGKGDVVNIQQNG